VATDNPRILELRRRVQADPASLAFAQLAEELRREGENDEAVGVCRAGLQHHPGSLTARVTLGRALIELDRLDEAFTELTDVLDVVPGHLPAIRALAEVYQRRGLMSEALVHYRRALQLAQHDTDLEHEVERIQRTVAPAAPAAGEPAAPVEALFDFDSLLAQLGQPAPAVDPPLLPPLDAPPMAAVETLELPPDHQDALAVVEQQLREREAQRAIEESRARAAEAERERLLLELEDWLSAITTDRTPHQSA
jgi:tetratricopeptide (TPR) repeat protein